MTIPQDFGAFFFWAFCALMTITLSIFAILAKQIREDFKDMASNLHSVAINLAQLSTKLESLDARLEKLERLREN